MDSTDPEPILNHIRLRDLGSLGPTKTPFHTHILILRALAICSKLTPGKSLSGGMGDRGAAGSRRYRFMMVNKDSMKDFSIIDCFNKIIKVLLSIVYFKHPQFLLDNRLTRTFNFRNQAASCLNLFLFYIKK